MRNFLLVLFITVNSFIFKAQLKVALHSNGNVSIFSGATAFNDAYNAATTGDTIYLPGGNLTYPLTINKGIVIYGAGHYPDSTTATNPTILTGDLNIGANADGLYIEGIYLTGTLRMVNEAKVDNVILKRSRFGAIHYQGSGTSNACDLNKIIQCVIDGDVNFQNSVNLVLSNSFIGGRFYNLNNGAIKNCIILTNNYYNYTFNNLDNSLVANNVFVTSTFCDWLLNGCENNTFANNVFRCTPSFGLNISENNYFNVDFTNFFVNQSGGTFNYNHNYHLQNPQLYSGNDGTQVGVYGGVYPYKEGAVPSNPHIQFKDIPSQTTQDGKLNILIKVAAQSE